MGSVLDKIKKAVGKAVLLAGYKAARDEIVVEHPGNERFGDYATTVAMILAKKEKRSVNDIARSIAIKIPQGKDSLLVEKVDVLGGYINITLKKSWMVNELKRVIKEGDKYGFNNTLRGKNVMVEFTDPNPFKEMHIGHLFSNTVGESIARLFEATGAIVKRANYQGDVGIHVAKAVWGMKKKLKEEGIALEDLARKPLSDKVRFLGQAYALGATAFKKDKNAAKEIKDYNYLCYLAAQERLVKEEGWRPQVNYKKYVKGIDVLYEEVKELYFKGRKWSLERFETVYQMLGTKYDYYFFESLAGEFGKKYVEENLKKGVFSISNGAIVYRGDKKGLHTRVFVNADGLPTYEAKDLGLAEIKYKTFKYDKSIIVTGSEVNEYFKVVLSALSEINSELSKKTIHIGHGMLRLPIGKMSSRTGKVLTVEWLIGEIKKRLVKILKERTKGDRELSEEDLNKIAVGAAKYAILKNDVKNDLIFDFDKSLSFEGHSGPYLQYTYARAMSILRKAQKSLNWKEFDCDDIEKNKDIFETDEEKLLLRSIYKFPEVVSSSISTLSPHRISNYIFDLAQKFSSFYDRCPVLHEEKEMVKKWRLLLVFTTAQVIKNGLYLLGIKTVEKM